MISNRMVSPFAVVLLSILFWANCQEEQIYLPNLTDSCLRCICYVVTKCDEAATCKAGYCGPFKISKVFWVDAGKQTFPDDDPERNFAWSDCARDSDCSKKIIRGYLQKFGKDCNDDGVTDCYDYLMVHMNGGYGCTTPLNSTDFGRNALARYEECRASI